MDIGISEVPQGSPDESDRPSLLGKLVDCLHLLDFLVCGLFMPISALITFLVSILPVS